MNLCVMLGNLTADPSSGKTQADKSWCKFCVAVDRDYTNANHEKITDFINIVAYDKIAENCAKYLEKGSKVSIRGALEIGSYKNRDGVTIPTAQIRAEKVEFLSRKTDGQQAQKSSADELKPVDDEAGDMPF